MRNHEVKVAKNLLNDKGHLDEPGWSRSLVQIYDRQQIKAPKWRIKEWDYYIIQNSEYVCCFTVSDNGYMGLESVSLIHLKTQWQHTESIVIPFPMGKLKMPASSAFGDVHYEDKRLRLSFKHVNNQRKITCYFKNFKDHQDFSCEFTLTETQLDSMVIATPWDENKKAFYYNQKINCMTGEGQVKFGDKSITFDPVDTFATLDWGRGVWTYDNTWYWGNGNGIVDGKYFGFNLGYGFGNTGAASENVVYFDGVLHKLDDIVFKHGEDYLQPWELTSSDGRFEGEFIPILNRSALTDYKLIVSDQQQVFGKLTANVVLDDGRKLQLHDLICFFEKVHNKF